MIVTAFEQGRLAVGEVTNPNVTDGCIGFDHASAFVDLGAHLDAPFASWHSLKSLRLHQFVGVVCVGDLQVEILPKLDGLPNPADIRRNLLEMLAVTEELGVTASEVVDYEESGDTLAGVLARLYCRKLVDALRRGLKQDYVVEREVLPRIRGKIHWPGQAVLDAGCRLSFDCVFDDRSPDTTLNRVLKAALLRIEPFLRTAAYRSLFVELRHAMGDVSDLCPSAPEVLRLRTDRTSHHLKPVLTLGKLLLGGRSPDLARTALGSRSTFAMTWDMNVLFEEYVARIAHREFHRDGVHVVSQTAGARYLASESHTQREAFLLVPDLQIRQKGSTLVVADTKWKRLDSSKQNLGVSSADIYQVLAYARRYRAGCTALIYPHHPAIGRPGVQKQFQILGDDAEVVLVKVATVDLASLQTVPEQLREALFDGDARGCA